jgi:membrane protein involved in colicin uptake
MEISTLLESAGFVLGGGGIVGFIVGFATFKWQRMKARGEARQAELEATKTEQDTYQEIVTDLKEHNEEMRKWNGELQAERKELSCRIEDNEKKIREQDEKIREQAEKIREQEGKIAEMEKKLELVTVMICGKANCQQRTKVFLDMIDDDSWTTRKDK